MELNYTNNFQMDIMADEKPTSAPNLPGRYYVEVPIESELKPELKEEIIICWEGGSFQKKIIEGKIFREWDRLKQYMSFWLKPYTPAHIREGVESAEELLNEILHDDSQRGLLQDTVITRKHNGLEYDMVRKDLAVIAMKEYASQFTAPAWAGSDEDNKGKIENERRGTGSGSRLRILNNRCARLGTDAPQYSCRGTHSVRCAAIPRLSHCRSFAR
jgi:hypothetical protein